MAISVSFARYSNLLVENHKIFIPHLYLAPLQGGLHLNFANMFDAGKTRMMGLPYGENLWRYVKPFSYNTSVSRTDRRRDRQTELLYQYRASVYWRAIKSNYDLMQSRSQPTVISGPMAFEEVFPVPSCRDWMHFVTAENQARAWFSAVRKCITSLQLQSSPVNHGHSLTYFNKILYNTI